MHPIRSALAAALLSGAAVTPAAADDTEVFFAPADDAGLAPNVVFTFDISGSMDEFDGTPYRRITRLKQAMLDILETTDGVNVGIGAFNGYGKGGAILQPAIDPDEDVCPDAACDRIDIRVGITSSSDDTTDDGTVRPDAAYLDFEDRIGLRFTDVDIPRGATIRHAVIEFVTQEADGDVSSVVVRAEDTGDAEPFRGNPSDFNAAVRPRTAASVTWSATPWYVEEFEEQTSDLGALVQAVVDRDDWCGGNAMAFQFEGGGDREAWSHDRNPWDAPVLKVSYDPSSIDLEDSCHRRQVVATITGDDDDVEQIAGGTLSSGSASLDPRRGGASEAVGLRFAGLDVPNGADITSAYLRLSSAGAGTGDATFAVRAESSDSAVPFSEATTDDVSDRTDGSATSWSVPPTVDGERMRSPDIGAEIADVVGRAGWNPGNALVLTLEQTGGGGSRPFHSREGAGAGARLEINYRLDARANPGALTTDPVPLRTARDDLIDTVLGFRFRASTPLVDAYYESALYLLGEPVDHGRRRGTSTFYDRYFRLSHPESYTGGSVQRSSSCLELDPNGLDCASEYIDGDPRYVAPPTGTCQANQIVLLSDGEATAATSKERIRTLTAAPTCESRDVDDEECAFELAEWLKAGAGHGADAEAGDSILTHAVGFNFSSPFLRDLATKGGGLFREAGSAAALTTVFREILDVAAEIDTGFVAPAATISQFNRVADRDDVYYAMFRPSLKTRWDGNLKRYGLNKPAGSDEVVVVDALNRPAFDALDGGIVSTAKSYWTDGAADGADVAAGGAANELVLPRTVSTWLRSSTDPTPAFVDLSEDTDEIDAAALGIEDDAALRTRILKWARGVDVDGDGAVRTQIGDPMHSTPYILNYPSSDPDGRSLIFFGTNEGYLHALETSDGSEAFAIVPPDLLPGLQRFYRDESTANRPYGLDGPISGYHADTNGNRVVDPGEKALVFVGMRRGGRNYYAFDVSDPDAPELAWEIRGGVTSGFDELGQSWSRPTLARVRHEGAVREVLVFGAGYDVSNDTRATHEPGYAPAVLGQGIFVVDALDGTLLHLIDTQDFPDLRFSMPSDVNVLDIDVDGLADMLWVGDMGGQLWRFDIDNDAGGTLGDAITGAAVGRFGGLAESGARRFHYPPDIALMRDDVGKIFMNVGIGSGWRAHPLDKAIEDRYYVLRDPHLAGPPTDDDGDVSYPSLGEIDLFDATTTSVRDDTSERSKSGWYIRLSGTGEKVLSDAVTVNGQILFTSYLPDVEQGDVCSVSVGGGRLYVLDALHGDPVDEGETDAADEDGEEELERRRWTKVRVPGIPPPVRVLTPSVDVDQPIGLVGGQKVDDLDFGASLTRTYWAEHGE